MSSVSESLRSLLFYSFFFFFFGTDTFVHSSVVVSLFVHHIGFMSLAVDTPKLYLVRCFFNLGFESVNLLFAVIKPGFGVLC